jgi:hypothetical protein
MDVVIDDVAVESTKDEEATVGKDGGVVTAGAGRFTVDGTSFVLEGDC